MYAIKLLNEVREFDGTVNDREKMLRKLEVSSNYTPMPWYRKVGGDVYFMHDEAEKQKFGLKVPFGILVLKN